MSKKMLIDAAHAEETRVVVLDGTRVEEFDFESRARKQLRGNIYLAKVIRVEPSLQAAFVEYGGNRHGFLAFNEIHPDYYQIPHADREALLREAEEDDDDHTAPGDGEALVEAVHGDAAEAGVSDSLGGEDDDEVDEEVARRRRRLMRRYKIQEVIKRRQIMLVQVVKEERGNKGAALTTYLSLAGRYCVLMPNTDRGGGISRKIAVVADRKRLRDIVADLDVPQGMGLIVRTAGAKRTKAEIKRDYEYLSRAWSNIRDTTLHSIAPALIYEEEDLVKRAIRDLFDKDIDGVWVEGEAGFLEARDFMRVLMPAQAKKVQAWTGPAPLFVAHKIEDHLGQIYSPTVPLRSGGYLVINQTEALVAVDVNSGRATRERNIEATALKTNLEAAEEAARQLRLRDLAGLIVIDFIDMDEAKNNRAVEKLLKDCLARDRARIQMGKISSFGLMELSRQRRRTGILEGTTHVCPNCQGAGRVRSVESSALSALRAADMEALKAGGEITLRVPADVALYILNQKREHLGTLLRTHGLFVGVEVDAALAHAEHEIERVSESAGPPPAHAPQATVIHTPERDYPDDDFNEADYADEEEAFEADEDETASALQTGSEGASQDGSGGSRRRRRRGRGRDEVKAVVGATEPPRAAPVDAGTTDGETEGDGAARRRRRGRRGGRRTRDEGRAGDTYQWSWPARLSGDDPYEWRGPVESAAPAPPEEAPAVATAPVAAAFEAEAGAALPAGAGATPPEDVAQAEEIWVELHEAEPAPVKPRRTRSGGRAKSAAAKKASVEPGSEPDAATADEPVARDAATPEALAPLLAANESAPETASPASEAEPAPLVAIEAQPTPPDPAEIAAPPAAPRKGWWRRGA